MKINADVLVQMLTLIIVKFTLSCRCRSSVIFGGKQATDRVVFIFSLPAFFSPRKATSNIQVVSESRLENFCHFSFLLLFIFFAQILQVSKAADSIPVRFKSQKQRELLTFTRFTNILHCSCLVWKSEYMLARYLLVPTSQVVNKAMNKMRSTGDLCKSKN